VDRQHRQLGANITVILSPIGIILILFLVAYLGGMLVGVWMWAVILVVYWMLIVFLIRRYSGREAIAGWLSPSGGHRVWKALALLPVVMVVPALGVS
jgi:hypothetical protein